MKLLVSMLILIFLAAAAVGGAETPDPDGVRLTRVRSIIGKGYLAVIFSFDRPIRPQSPKIEGNQIITRFTNTATTLDGRRDYSDRDLWVALEPAEGDLTARIGLPEDFSRMDHYLSRRQTKWIIRLYKKQAGDTAPPLESVDNKKKTDRMVEESDKTEPSATAETENGPAPVRAEKRDAPRETLTANGLLTLNFFQSDIQEILSALAIEREINIATSQEVTGTVSVHLYQVTLAEALDAIALAGGFRFRKDGELYYVYKPKDMQDPQAAEREMKIFRLQYTEPAEIETVLKTLPNMGTIGIHKPSQTLIVEDTPRNIEKIESILGFWDRKPKQVLIEAKILEVDLTNEMNFGVNWAKVLGEFNIGTQGFSSATLPATEPVSPLPGGSAAGIFGNLITAIGTNHQFAMALDALEAKTKINTLSTPKVLAIHGKEAKVQVGGQQGYRVTTTNLGVATETIEFIDTGTILKITPYIDDNGGVLLSVQPSIQDAKIETGGIPVVKSTNVATWLLANSGETVFIGGLIKDKDEKARQGLPCFANLPAVGPLFGKTSTRYNKTELVVMITPLIVGDGLPYVQEKEKAKIHRQDEKFSRYPLPTREQIREFIKPME